MKNKSTRGLVISLIIVSALCVLVFSFLAMRMNTEGADAIGDIGSIYMAGMSEQAAAHFGTTIELRLSQVGSLVDSVPPGSQANRQQMLVALRYYARARGFDHLALVDRDGNFEMLYGSQIDVQDADAFARSLRDGEEKMAYGRDETGENLVLMGVPAAYSMENGGTSMALVTALPAEYISDTLSLSANNALIYYCIIDQNGGFIVKDSEITESNYFDRVHNHYDSVEGLTGDQYIEKLQQTMANSESFTSEFTLDGERRHLYCNQLPYSDWYLMLFMPYGQLDLTVQQLSQSWGTSALVSCLVVLLALLAVFSWYIGITRRQMRELDEARQAAEHARQAAEHANRAKSEFLSNMSHDIRTPMNGIVGMTAIATANIHNPQQVQNCLKKISLSSRHLLGLINDILDMAKIESGKLTLRMEQMSLQDTMQGIVNIVQPQVNAKGQRFDVYVKDIICENVFCDSIRLNQVLLNLLGNAIKFTPEGGSISASLSEEACPGDPESIRVHLKIKDTGIGMSPEFQAKIFESFSREDNARVQKTEGAGLGMAITKYIVDAMHGTITVQSEAGKGTEFHVILDLKKSTTPEVDMHLPGWNVLLIDDDPLLCESTIAALEAIGCTGKAVSSGKVALEELSAHPTGTYPVALVDWKMVGMDGIETAKRIRGQMGDQIVILMITSADWSDLEPLVHGSGINGIVPKPLFRSTLFYALQKYTGDAAHEADAADGNRLDLSGKRVILAEDNDLNWEIAKELFSDLGLELDWAENGKACLDLFQQSPVGWYDAILMDIRMPLMNGYEATEAIRKLDRPDAKRIPIIAMSADAFSDDVQRCLSCGMNAHTAKPIDLDEAASLLVHEITAYRLDGEQLPEGPLV